MFTCKYRVFYFVSYLMIIFVKYNLKDIKKQFH